VTSSGRTAREWRRALRAPAAVAALLVLAAVLAVVGGAGARRGALDPLAADPAGSRALAVLLAGQGVAVRRSTDLLAAAAAARPGDTVLVAFAGSEPLAALSQLAGRPGVQVVLVGADPSALDAVRSNLTVAGSRPVGGLTPGCALPAAVRAGDADLGGLRYRARSTVPAAAGVGAGTTSCYDATLVTGRTAAGAPLTVLGAGDLLTNDRLGHRGNAALALGLLGTGPTLHWVLPGGGTAGGPGGQRSLAAVLPRWVAPVAVQLLVAAGLLALWRGRRLGPVVAEPLPVVVRAAETVEGRARLYRRVGARAAAAGALRAGALARLGPPLGLGGDADPPAVVQAVAERAGRPAEQVRELLYGGSPADDRALVALAGGLDRLVRATVHDWPSDQEGSAP